MALLAARVTVTVKRYITPIQAGGGGVAEQTGSESNGQLFSSVHSSIMYTLSKRVD